MTEFTSSPTQHDRPWAGLYSRSGLPRGITVEHATALEMFRAAVTAAGERVLLRSDELGVSGRELDVLTDALAVGLVEAGVEPGDRVALYMQNVPEFALTLVATWKAAAIAVPCSPMLTERELTKQLVDCRATVVVSAADSSVAVAGDAMTTDATVLTTQDVWALAERHRGERPSSPDPGHDDIATIVYTSGTTGPSKGATNLHRNVVFSSQVYRDWYGVTDEDVILAIAPLFHMTGLIAHLGIALAAHAELVLIDRFDPARAAEAVEHHRVTFLAGAMTVYTALLEAQRHRPRDLSSLRLVLTGGAPVAPAVAERWLEQTGTYMHNVYGLTESTSTVIAVPVGLRAPLDPLFGALSVGVPVFDTDARVVDEAGHNARPGVVGEILVRGPQLVPGYWKKPEESARAVGDGWLRTGDVGYMDEEGWFYLVDRSKDMIIASGYKVWPRDVEDALYEHPAVHEVAVIGKPDDYRGETVVAFVSLSAGATVSEADLIAFARERLAAYKAPREITVLSELPKTNTGKILRRTLRGRW